MFKSSYADIQPQIEAFFLENFGWKVSWDSQDFDQRIEKVCKKIGFKDTHACLLSLIEDSYSQNTLKEFTKEFTIGESYFFRDKNFFNLFEQKMNTSLSHS